jgi:hypothetical protein
MAFKTKFKEVLLDQEKFGATSIRAIKEIYAVKFDIEEKDIRNLDFRECLKALKELEQENKLN